MKGIIYKYTSPSGKVYIGQTCRERGRRSDFRKSISYGGAKIDNARKKYGPGNFKYEVLFQIESNNQEEILRVLNEREQYYIELYKSNLDKYGYNMTTGGAGCPSHEVSQEMRIKMGKASRERIAINGHPMKGKNHSQESIAKMKKNTKKKYGKDNPNFGWKPQRELLDRLAEMSRLRVGDKNPFFGKHHTEETKNMARKRYGKRVRQYDAKTFEFIKEFESTRQAAEMLGYNPKRGGDISKVCNRHIRNDGVQIITALGYRWKWADDTSIDFPAAKIPPPPSFKGRKLTEEHKRGISARNSKAVKQIDPISYKVVKIHKSPTMASTALGHPRSNSDIGKMCNGKLPPSKKLVLGFIWEWL